MLHGTATRLGLALVACVWVQPVAVHTAPSCFLAHPQGFDGSRGSLLLTHSRPAALAPAVRRTPARFALRAGLGDAVRNLWPFKKNEEDQYKDRKDVWTSLVVLDQVTGGELQVLVKSLTATGLWKELAADGKTKNAKQEPVTLFASLNSAFAQLPKDCLLADCVAAIEDQSATPKTALLEELRTSLLGSIADGRYSISALDGKKTAITTRSGRSANLDLMPGTRAADFTDYVLDMQLRRKVKVCSASSLVSKDLHCSNGVIHIVDKLPDGSLPIVRLISADAAPTPKTESEANALQKELYKAQARKRELEAELECLTPLVEDNMLTRESLKELVDTYERQAADYASYQTRAEQDLKRASDSAATTVLASLYTVLDRLELAATGLKAETPPEKAIQKEYQQVNDELLLLLQGLGVECVEALGTPFDARCHEAIQMEESTEYEEQVVCKQYQRGYMIAQRLVRPALVVVSSGPGPVASVPSGSTVAESKGTGMGMGKSAGKKGGKKKK